MTNLEKSVEEIVEETMEDISEHIYIEPMSLGQARDYEKARWIETLQAERQRCEEIKKEWYIKGVADGTEAYEKALTQPNNPK